MGPPSLPWRNLKPILVLGQTRRVKMETAYRASLSSRHPASGAPVDLIVEPGHLIQTLYGVFSTEEMKAHRWVLSLALVETAGSTPPSN